MLKLAKFLFGDFNQSTLHQRVREPERGQRGQLPLNVLEGDIAPNYFTTVSENNSPARIHNNISTQKLEVKGIAVHSISSHHYGKQLLLLRYTLNQFFSLQTCAKIHLQQCRISKIFRGDPQAPTSIDPLLCCHNAQVSSFCLIQLAL